MLDCNDDNAATLSTIPANKYSYNEDWGEKYTGITHLGLFVFNLGSGKVCRVPGPGEGAETVGQPVFTPCGTGVVYTSWPTAPKRLGMIYCYQRPCSVNVSYWNTSDSTWTERKQQRLTPHLKLARYPVFAPSSDKPRLVFLGSENGFDMHNNSCQLFVFDFDSYTERHKAGMGEEVVAFCRCIIDHIPGAGICDSSDAAVNINGYSFPGLFAGGLKASSFLNENTIMVEVQWRSYASILCVDIDSGDFRVLSFDGSTSSFYLSQAANTKDIPSGKEGAYSLNQDSTPEITNSWLSECPFSISVLDCSRDAIFTVSCPTVPQRLAIFSAADFAIACRESESSSAKISTVISGTFCDIIVCKSNRDESKATKDCRDSDLRSFILHTRLTHESYSTTIESILLLPPVGECSPPLLVSPHGGPHSAFSTSYVAQYNYLCAAGFAILMVNYRGSTVYADLHHG